MINKLELTSNDVYKSKNINDFNFKTTEGLNIIFKIIGQDRGVKAIKFGLDIVHTGYNIFVTGATGTGKRSITRYLANKWANKQKRSLDYVYVYNFSLPNHPIALSFPAGEAKRFKFNLEKNIRHLVLETFSKRFKKESYETKLENFLKNIEKKQTQLIEGLNNFAKERNISIQVKDGKPLAVPLNKKGEILNNEIFNKLTEEEKKQIKQNINEVNKYIEDINYNYGRLELKKVEQKEFFDRRFILNDVNATIDDLKEKFGYTKKIKKYLTHLKGDILKNISTLKGENGKELLYKIMFRYQINLFIDRTHDKHAPVYENNNSTYADLFGSIQMFSDNPPTFMDIVPGYFHKANGGVLILPLNFNTITKEGIWEGIKRAIKYNNIKIDYVSGKGRNINVGLDPESIPFDMKIIIISSRSLYEKLYDVDNELPLLFKVRADFETFMKRNKTNEEKYVNFIVWQIDKFSLKHFSNDAVAKIIEYGSRLAGNQKRLSTRFDAIINIMEEANYWTKNSIVTSKDIEKALQEKSLRSRAIHDYYNELIRNGDIIIKMKGEEAGSINGLSVIDLGTYTFGKPIRITARSYAGKDGIINVEREVDMSGQIHSKGIMIIQGLIGELIAKDIPFSVNISIGFEQTYDEIDGDSASSTEFYAAMSALSNIPIKQYIAVTGAVNQLGEIESVGGINEKVEGFYEICKLYNFPEGCGVIIPKRNIDEMMLKKEVLNAMDKGSFHIWAVENVSQGIEILTNYPLGEIGKKGTVLDKAYTVLKNTWDALKKD